MDVATNMATQFTQSFGDGMANIVVQGEQLMDVLGNIGRLLLSQGIQTAISLMLGGGGMLTGQGITGGLFGSILGVNDALIRNDGSVIQFHPDDDILASRDFSRALGFDESPVRETVTNINPAMMNTSAGSLNITGEIKGRGRDIVLALDEARRTFG